MQSILKPCITNVTVHLSHGHNELSKTAMVENSCEATDLGFSVTASLADDKWDLISVALFIHHCLTYFLNFSHKHSDETLPLILIDRMIQNE